MRKQLLRYLKILGIPVIVFLVALLLSNWADPVQGNRVERTALFAVPSLALGLALAWQDHERQKLEHVLHLERESSRHSQARLQEAVKESAESGRRLQTVLSFNRRLIEAQDERMLMNSALSMLNELTGALGCSFVPVDEWEQPLPAFTYGQLPEPVLRAWAAHLSGTMLRDRCGDCDVLQSTPGGCPLHPSILGDSLMVYCLPLMGREVAVNGDQSHRPRLGILHLYLPPGRDLDGEMRIFLEGLLQEIALVVESVRMREQEMTTLRQIQMLHASEGSLADSLGGLLEGLQQALEAEYVILRLRPSSDERLSGLNIHRGRVPAISFEEMEAIFTRVLGGDSEQSGPGMAEGWLALPLRLPEGQVPGGLLVGGYASLELQPRQGAILQTVAAQAALLVENERMLRSLEYKAVIQERTRLAREIHDGLAQTLAFLKLQAAQMQTYLDKGDLSRLSQVLKDNYQALAEAYLDTRQSIDNLRITPREGLEAWLERVSIDFESASGVSLNRRIQPLTTGWRTVISPEIQAQLIRIVQEALNNVRKHARAQQVSISLHEWQGDLVMEIRDDGRGFDPEDIPVVSQHGLRGIRERAELIGADFQIVSQAYQGTVVRLVLPAYLKEASR